MKTAEQIKEKSNEIVTAYELAIKKCSTAQEAGVINGVMGVGVISMLAEIVMQLADMNERARQRSVEPSNDESLATMLLRELRDEEIKTA